MKNTHLFRSGYLTYWFVCIGLIGFVTIAASADDPGPSSNETKDSHLTETPFPHHDAAMERWDDEIRKLELLDENQQADSESILILGSSSIRLWESAKSDLAPYRVIQRGYGGAKYSDLAVFAKRLIKPHSYRGLVMFVGNDVKGSENDHSPEQVEQWIRYILDLSKKHQPDSAAFLIEVTPTPKRLKAWPEIRQINAMMREVALTTPDVYFVATAGRVLGSDSKPQPNLFRDDRLHLSVTGYELWSGLIKRRLDEVLSD